MFPVHTFRRINEAFFDKKRVHDFISHLDLSKSVAESEPPCGVGAVRVCPALIFIFLDFLRGPPAATGFASEAFVIRSLVSETVVKTKCQLRTLYRHAGH
jgi:hypothetical protein